jgi:hypothetical protein
MTDLSKLGFQPNMIAETLVSTYTVDGLPNAAPMGVIRKSRESVLIRPYVKTLTYQNLRSQRCAVVNITDDPDLFYRTAFKEANPGGKLPLEWFERAKLVNAPRLKMADAFLEVNVKQMKRRGSRAEVVCDVKLVELSNLTVKPYCRAHFAAIESVIHATRVKEFLKSGKSAEANALLKLIEHYRDITSRVYPGSSDARIIESLLASYARRAPRKRQTLESHR